MGSGYTRLDTSNMLQSGSSSIQRHGTTSVFTTCRLQQQPYRNAQVCRCLSRWRALLRKCSGDHCHLEIDPGTRNCVVKVLAQSLATFATACLQGSAVLSTKSQ
eukprot:175436-Prorocentrum_minimum.AAC.2